MYSVGGGFESCLQHQYTDIAQLVEHSLDKRQVIGSSPVIRTKISFGGVMVATVVLEATAERRESSSLS